MLEKVRGYQQEPEINLIFVPIKQNRIDFLLEKATELGATKLIPILTKHSVVDKINLNKWHIYIKEAAEQCRRLSIPKIYDLQNLNSFLKTWNEKENIIFCNEREENLSLMQYLRNQKNNKINILVGPEGGFSEDELNLLLTKKFITSVHLGERILRSETACLSALSVISQYLI